MRDDTWCIAAICNLHADPSLAIHGNCCVSVEQPLSWACIARGGGFLTCLRSMIIGVRHDGSRVHLLCGISLEVKTLRHRRNIRNPKACNASIRRNEVVHAPCSSSNANAVVLSLGVERLFGLQKTAAAKLYNSSPSALQIRKRKEGYGRRLHT